MALRVSMAISLEKKRGNSKKCNYFSEASVLHEIMEPEIIWGHFGLLNGIEKCVLYERAVYWMKTTRVGTISRYDRQTICIYIIRYIIGAFQRQNITWFSIILFTQENVEREDHFRFSGHDIFHRGECRRKICNTLQLKTLPVRTIPASQDYNGHRSECRREIFSWNVAEGDHSRFSGCSFPLRPMST